MRVRSIRLHLVALTLSIVVSLVLAEIVLRVVSPTPFLFPRYEFSPEYGLRPLRGVRMVHGLRGRWRLHYTINEQGWRGAVPDRSADGDVATILVLGDSNAFGMGVGDGEEFPAVMGAAGDGVRVLNLASPAWGLTQQIRCFYEAGLGLDPEIVVLQFCANDPEDNLQNRVTTVSDGEFVFVNSSYSMNRIKKYLSRSVVQRSQVYCFFRHRVARSVRKLFVRREIERNAASPAPSAVPVTESVHLELLELFARDLSTRDVRLVMIAAGDGLDRFPHIRRGVGELEERGWLTYVEVREWLAGMEAYGAPDGHVWGTKAHRVIGRRLAAHVGAMLDARPLVARD